MLEADHPSTNRLALYLTPEHDCSYLPGRRSQTLFLDPYVQPQPSLLQQLLSHGFRRSGDHVYRPHCPDCRSCVAVRIPVADFKPRRSQRRCQRRNADGVQVRIKPPQLDADHYRLYLRYTGARHSDGGMADMDETRYLEFLTTRWCDTLFVEFRRGERLMAVAVTDRLPNALSAVYTFFDPRLSEFSPGAYSILWQIAEARRRGLEHLYLGYWIGESGKMSYKEQYRPLEAWDGSGWRRFEAGEVVKLDFSPQRHRGHRETTSI